MIQPSPTGTAPDRLPLARVGRIDADKVLNPERLAVLEGLSSVDAVLVVLAAGRGTRFGRSPKVIQPVCGVPLARRTIDAFQALGPAATICVVGYRHEEVMAALGPGPIYVRSDDSAGGTALAVYECFSVPQLASADPLLIVTMGDRVISAAVFRRVCETHRLGAREATLTMLTARYEPPKQVGKGRVVRDGEGRVVRIVEQRDIDAMADTAASRDLQSLSEGNCPLYAVRARALKHHLAGVSNDNAQSQFYLPDIVASMAGAGGDLRTVTVTPDDPEYDLVTSDVTRPRDLALLEGILRRPDAGPAASQVEAAGADLASDVAATVAAIAQDRPAGQAASIAAQLAELLESAARRGLDPDRPVGIGIAGGRVRIAFMHPDMARFYGPAWQMPCGAADADGREQIVVLVQAAEDGRIHLLPADPRYQEKLDAIDADEAVMYPDDGVSDWHTYEGFGTRMSEHLLLSLGYFSDAELDRRRAADEPLPPSSMWVRNSMRRPFCLVGNAIASLRTLREGNLGARVQTVLGRAGFRGLSVMSTGAIPQGGFASSSAVTVAVKNAMNALFELGIAPDLLIHLACQAEYGTGVRAGSLDQATEQKGRFGVGTLISSNPRENYRAMGTYPVPSDRFHVLFAYSVDRDREAWEWSAGRYVASPAPGRLTTAEVRKMTGKAAEIAALLTRLPLDRDFFQDLEPELVRDGRLGEDAERRVREVLLRLPLCVRQADLRPALAERRGWYMEQLIAAQGLDAQAASERADTTIAALLAGWRDPCFERTEPSGRVVSATGLPLRAVVAYLFGEVARSFRLLHDPDGWIEHVTRSQWGDRSVDIDPSKLPSRQAMAGETAWERGVSGPDRLARWLERAGATPFDYDRDLDDTALASGSAPLHLWPGGNFFRGLALMDLAEAMLKRAFGPGAIAIRVNAAGQGDYFQVHVDTSQADVADVRDFIEQAFYRRFDLRPPHPFVHPHPGGPALGVRLARLDQLQPLVEALGGGGGREQSPANSEQ